MKTPIDFLDEANSKLQYGSEIKEKAKKMIEKSMSKTCGCNRYNVAVAALFWAKAKTSREIPTLDYISKKAGISSQTIHNIGKRCKWYIKLNRIPKPLITRYTKYELGVYYRTRREEKIRSDGYRQAIDELIDRLKEACGPHIWEEPRLNDNPISLSKLKKELLRLKKKGKS